MMQDYLLTITVPTYNRFDKLKKLAQMFLFEAVEMDRVEVVICDNSNNDYAPKNKALFKRSAVRYICNEKNLGFHGNLMQCIHQAQGQWLWIISDDDDVDIQAFSVLIAALQAGRFDKYSGVMLPYFIEKRNLTGKTERYLTNTEKDWGDVGTVKDLITDTGKVPFILFSSVLVSLRNKNLQITKSIFNQHAPNDYMQFFLFASLIGDNGMVSYWHKPLQVYRTAYEGRFPLLQMMESMDRCLLYIGETFEINLDEMQKKQWHGWAIWYARHRAGEVSIQSAENAYERLLQHALSSLDIKMIGLLLVARWLPKKLFQKLWVKIL